IAGLPSASIGSNGWVVAPTRTRSGRALFAFDSHDSFAMPNLFHELHLFYGDGRQLRGWSIAGLPGVVNGFNECLAWGLTNIGDSQDLFIETRDPDDTTRFKGRSGWYQATVEHVTIPVRGSDAQTVRIVLTENGRLISDDPPLALRWSALELGELGIDALLDMNVATSWDQFDAALDGLAAPSTQVTYADVSGRIASRTVGVLPQRGKGTGLVPLRGEDPDSAWIGLLPTSALPRSIDPAVGFIAAANARLTPSEGFPLVSDDNAPGYRMRRITQVLGDNDALDVDDMRALQVDWFNTQASLLLGPLTDGIDRSRLTPQAVDALVLLERWASQPINARDSAAATIYERWYITLADALFEPTLGAVLLNRLKRNGYVLNHALDWLILSAPTNSWWRNDRSGIITDSFQRAVDELQRTLDAPMAAWHWELLHTLEFRHELSGAVPLLGRLLDRGPFPWGGGNPTVGRARYDYDRPFAARAGATVRVVIEMSNPMRAYAIMPGGQSGHFLSAHYDDQIPAWLAGELVPLAATPEDVGTVATKLVP
ncbi:MAG: penicillin acylase family protein, partial [Gammaproteobacteria bacterium]|nr:penicillin acylase family protein [Gammaproteobacteria bacterium]